MRTINNRMFWLIAAALLISFTSVSTASASDGMDALKYVPKDSIMVAVLNVDQFKDSGIYDDIDALVADNKDAKEALSMLSSDAGFDYTKHLNTLVMVAPPEAMDDDDQFIVIAEGTFNETKIIKLATDKGANFVKADASCTSLCHYTIEGEGAIIFYEGAIVVGPKELVQKAIDAEADSKKSLASNDAMSALLDDLKDSKGTDLDLWFLATVPAKAQTELAKNLPAAGDIETLSGALDLKTGLGLNLYVMTSNADSAKALQDIINDGIAEGKKDSTVKSLKLDGMFDNIKVSAKDKALNVTISLSDSELTTLQTTIQSMLGGMIR